MDHELVLNVLGFNIYYIIEITGYFLFALIGSCSKEIYLFKVKRESTHIDRMWRILLGTIVATFMGLAFKDWVLGEQATWKIMSFVCYLFGILGFDLFGKFSSIEGIKELAKDIHEIYENITHQSKPEEDTSKQKDKPKT